MMGNSKRISLIGLVLAMAVAVGCAPLGQNEPSASTQSSALSPQSSPPKRIVAAIKSEPRGLIRKTNQSGIGLAGSDALEELVNAGLAMEDSWGGLNPQLGVEVPTLENGLWRLLPDGRMETVWQLKPGTRWHDGTPFSVGDVLFTMRVMLDRDMAIFRQLAFESIESIDAASADTVTVRWKQPFVEADQLFSPRVTTLLPLHLVEKPYTEDKTNFEQLAYWSRDYVGTGPFKLRDWMPGSGAVLDAFDRYVLGRPKLDQIEVRFITDPAALAANLLAGAVDMSLGRNLSLDQSLQIRDQWREGRAEIGMKNWIMIYPQFVDPSPAVVGDVRFRRALMHAIDRQEMVDSLMAGLTAVAHTLLNLGQPDYVDVEQRVPKYEYDPRKAAQFIEGLGYARGPDGVFQGTGGQRLAIEIRTTQGDDLQEKSMFATSGYWQRIGISMDPVPVPPQRSQDREYRNTYPAFDVRRQPNDTESFRRMHSSKTPLPETSFVGENYSRYMNAEFDALLDRYFVAIARPERIQVVSQLAMHVADRLNLMGLFYQAEPTMISNRVIGARVAKVGGSSYVGNVHEWDVK